MLDLPAYLARIQYSGPLEPTLDTLRALHRAHLLAVPFENLDIPRGRPLALDVARLFDKVVTRRRGGFCFELNGLFAILLRELGFDVTLLGATVLLSGGEPREDGLDTAHLVLLVTLEDRWIVDIGFGASFVEPLRFDERGEQHGEAGTFRIDRQDDRYTLLKLRDDGTWERQYGFTFLPRSFDEFVGPCAAAQQSPFWRDRSVCTIATPDGRLTISDRKLITTSGGSRQERAIQSDEEYARILRDHFGVELAD